jgi:lipid-A-disaccharide synthase
LAILIDFPDFNMRLAKSLRVLRIPIIYFISPQVWAWRSRRIHQIKALVNRMIVVLPFEKEFYAGFGMEVDYVGHPLLDRVRPTCSRDNFSAKHGLQPGVLTVSLLPGSRTKEVKYHLPILLQAARNLVAACPLQFLIPLASTVNRRLVQKIWQEEAPDLSLKIIEGETYNAVSSSDLAVVASGTATLETALLGTPLIAIFKISNLTWIIGQYLIDVPHYCLVNLIAGKRLVPELYQKEFNAERLCQEMRRFLEDPGFRNNAKIELVQLRDQLGSGGAISKAAEKIRGWLLVQSPRSGEEV